MSHRTESPLVKMISLHRQTFDDSTVLHPSIRKSACVRERSCSWDAVIGQGNKVDKRISHKRQHKFQLKGGKKKGPFPFGQKHAVCLYMSIQKTI